MQPLQEIPCPLFDCIMLKKSLEDFGPCMSFDAEMPLDERVESDHAEILVEIPDSSGSTMSVWNISNPIFQHYDHKGPFIKTHMYAQQPVIADTEAHTIQDNKLVPNLERKIENQINAIVERWKKNKVQIQIIVEGYPKFYEQLRDKLAKTSPEKYSLSGITEDEAKTRPPHTNIIGILINENVFEVLESSYIRYMYAETDKSFVSRIHPWVLVQHKLRNSKLLIVGVHIKGYKSQYPKNGIEALATKVQGLYKQYRGEVDVIAAGDYNTVPKNTKRCLKKLNISATILPIPYPTHINPLCQSGVYDQIMLLQRQGSDAHYRIKPKEALLESSQAYIASLEKNRRKYIEQELRKGRTDYKSI